MGRFVVATLGFFLALFAAGPAAAKTWVVAAEGTDSPACGGKAAPCRSLNQAISLAAEGDSIVVGPGRYGDLDGDGVLGEPGEELAPAGCGCMIHVPVRLSLRSRDGAEATVLDAGGTDLSVVSIDGDGAAFGRKGRGFSVTRAGLSGFGVRTSDAASDVSVVGNLAYGNGSAGFYIHGAGQVVADNRARGNVGAGFRIVGTGHAILRNVSAGNDVGFDVQGSDHQFVGDLAVGNGLGFAFQGTAHVLQRSAVLGNRRVGINLMSGARPTIEQCSVVGNDAEGSNCGLLNASQGAVEATRIWWGAATGPGPDPADDSCLLGGASATTVEPVATKEIKVKVAPFK